MRVVCLVDVINGSGIEELAGVTCAHETPIDLPEDKALRLHARGIVRIIREDSPPKTEEIETTAAPPAPERAVSKRGAHGRFVKASPEMETTDKPETETDEEC